MRRISIAVYCIVAVFGIFLFRLWYLQVIRGTEYKRIDENNRLRVLNISAPRGIIYDRNGTPLVRNVPSFDITLVREDFPDDPAVMSELASLINMKPDEITAELDRASVRPFRPVVLKEDVTLQEVARVEARRVDLPGVQIDVVGSREYLYGRTSSHVLGYLGIPGIQQLRQPEFRDVPPESFIGQFGVEKVYDAVLRGLAGKKVIEVDALGRIMKVVRIQRPVQGRDIQLTIDIDLQQEAAESLKDKAGAVVALRPSTGEVLALASAPAFDPNHFARGIDPKEWKTLIEDPRKPLLNRAIQSQYPPGSTFKIITAISALEENIITPEKTVYCAGSIEFGRTFKCWKEEGHGTVDLRRALTESCDVYFYEIGKRLDIDRLAYYASGYGLGRPTGIDLEGETAGIVPSSAWKLRNRGTKWFTGETLNTVIGQGYLSVSPVQMANMMATVVNGGILHRPYLTGLVEHGEGTDQHIDIRPDTIAVVKDALLDVVNSARGTGKLARSDAIIIGGKTGTSQVVGSDAFGETVPSRYRDHAWFVAFAPEDNPEIAVSVFVEHGGHGSTGAAPIAKRIMESYYNPKPTAASLRTVDLYYD